MPETAALPQVLALPWDRRQAGAGREAPVCDPPAQHIGQPPPVGDLLTAAFECVAQMLTVTRQEQLILVGARIPAAGSPPGRQWWMRGSGRQRLRSAIRRFRLAQRPATKRELLTIQRVPQILEVLLIHRK